MDTLLVIGNGFDLSANAKSSYNSFFESDYYSKRKESAQKWVNNCIYAARDSSRLEVVNMEEYICNCWDILFYMESIEGGWLYDWQKSDWCDIEQVIHDSLINTSRNKMSWSRVYEDLHRYYYEKRGDLSTLIQRSHNNIERNIEIYMCCCNWEEYSKNKNTFYRSLLEQLNGFEQFFGGYIQQETARTEYKEKAKSLMECLINEKIDNLSYNLNIDSFNYSDFLSGEIPIRHINGDYNNPIFGVELSEEEKSISYNHIFTKTSRRLRQDSFCIQNGIGDGLNTIDKVIVFGHSLNKMDYDYYNYIFTMLQYNTFDIDKMGVIEFVFRVYDDRKQIDIRNNYTNKVYALLKHFEKHAGNINSNVLINMLRFSGKLKIYEI